MGTEKTEPEVVGRAGAKVIESLVLRGDLSGLGPADRAKFYVQMCEGLGLNPHAQPFAFLRLSGKEVLYATRGATDQLAAMHNLNREIVDGPKAIDLAGTKLVYAVCRASHPNGRVETATATVPLVDPVNVLMKCECVPLDSEILTRRGFRHHDELAHDEEVLAYDRARDVCEWVPLEGVSVYHDAPIATLHTAQGQFSVRCTPNHSWAVEVPARASRRNELVEARAIKTHHRLILAAPGPSGAHPMPPERAAVLGWVMCDGTIQRRGSYVALCIYQSKPDRVQEIRELLDAAGLPFREDTGAPTRRTFPSGQTYDCLPQHAFWLDGETSWWLLQEAGLAGSEGLPALVTRLSWSAREAMLGAMLAADGDAYGNFGKKRKPGVMEAFQILTTLQGRALGMLRRSSTGGVPIQRAMGSRYVAGSNLALTPAGRGSVWCPTTRHGTWVMRQDGRITITGNTKAKRRATLSILGLAILDEVEAAADGARGDGVDLSRAGDPDGADAPKPEAPVGPLAAFHAAVASLEDPPAVVRHWRRHRAEAAAADKPARVAAFEALVARLRDLDVEDPGAWLRGEIAAADRRAAEAAQAQAGEGEGASRV